MNSSAYVSKIAASKTTTALLEILNARFCCSAAVQTETGVT